MIQEFSTERMTPKQEARASRRTLVMRHMGEGLKYARKCCRGLLTDEILTSRVYAGLVKAAERFDPTRLNARRFFVYAKVFVRSEVWREWRGLDVVRNRKHISENDLPEEDRPEQPTTEPEYGAIFAHDEWEKIEPLLRRLTDRERLVIDMVFLQGKNYREVGDALGISRSAAQQDGARALGKLRRWVGDKLDK